MLGRRGLGGWLAQDVVARWCGARGTRRRRRGSLQGEHWLVVLAGSLDSHDRAAVGTVETDRANAYEPCFLSLYLSVPL